MGLNNLFAVVISDGSALLIKGGKIKSEHYWWKREIANLSIYKGCAEEAWGIDMDLLPREVSRCYV
jgi:hypothetical protein